MTQPNDKPATREAGHPTALCASTNPDRADTPTVWVLLDDRPGNTTQAIGLAETLGWPYQRKRLCFNALANVHNHILGSTHRTIDPGESDTLEPPWPKVVISAGRRTAPVARWIGKQSSGRSLLVQLGRRGGNVADAFDAVITPLHTRLLPHPRRIETLGPLNPVNPERLEQARTRWPDLGNGLARPLIALLVGGSTPRYTLDAAYASRMGVEVNAYAQAQSGSLVVLTSRRTGPQATRALIDSVAPEVRVSQWQAEVESPYLGYLAQADILIVTGESESMLAEVAALGKPMFIYPVPQKPPTRKLRLKEWILGNAQLRSDGGAGDLPWFRAPIQSLCAKLIGSGLIMPPRRIDLLHQALIDRGIAQYFGQPWGETTPRPLRETADVADKLKALLLGPDLEHGQ